MRTFKQYLTEFAETWSVKDLVFGDISRTYVHIPLSLPMWKRITEINDMYGVHTTSIEGMERLIKLQGSSAQVSTADFATEVGIESMAGGIATDGGAVALIKGLAVFEGDEDVYSYQDKQGRRWVSIENFMDAFPTLGIEVDKIKHKIYKKLEPELEKLWLNEYDRPLSQGQFSDLARFGKTANKGIRMYFDAIEKFLKKTSTQGKMKNALRLNELGDYNENVITKFKIETVMYNKRKLAVKYSMDDDILNRLLPKSGVASDRPPSGPFLEGIRKKVGMVQLVPDIDFMARVEELISTANMMNSRHHK